MSWTDHGTYDLIADGRIVAEYVHEPPAQPHSFGPGTVLRLENGEHHRTATVARVVRVTPNAMGAIPKERRAEWKEVQRSGRGRIHVRLGATTPAKWGHGLYDVIADGEVIAEYEHNGPDAPFGFTLDKSRLVSFTMSDGSERRAMVEKVIRVPLFPERVLHRGDPEPRAVGSRARRQR